MTEWSHCVTSLSRKELPPQLLQDPLPTAIRSSPGSQYWTTHLQIQCNILRWTFRKPPEISEIQPTEKPRTRYLTRRSGDVDLKLTNYQDRRDQSLLTPDMVTSRILTIIANWWPQLSVCVPVSEVCLTTADVSLVSGRDRCGGERFLWRKDFLLINQNDLSITTELFYLVRGENQRRGNKPEHLIRLYLMRIIWFVTPHTPTNTHQH